jgi:hypothetical protein
MDSKIVTKEINSCIRPLLKKNGFDKWTSRTFWRYGDERIDIIDFQSFNSYNAEVIGCTTFSIAINLSCYLRYIPSQTEIKNKDSEPRPREEQVQNKLKRLDIWYIDNDSDNLIDVMIDCGQQIERNGINWFNQFDTKEKVLNILTDKSEDLENIFGFGNLDSPIRNEYTAYTAIGLGKFDLAIDRFERLGKYYMEQYQKQKYPYYLDRKRLIDNEIEKIKTNHNSGYV